MKGLAESLYHSFRKLARNPAFTAVVVFTLGLGIGASTAIFSVIKAVLLTPLPYAQSDRLVAITSQFPKLNTGKFKLSSPEFLELQERMQGLGESGAYKVRAINLQSPEAPLRVESVFATASLFVTLRVKPALGRTFTPAEDRPNAEPVIVLGNGLWRRAFGGDARIIGRRIDVDGEPTTVVGVMPPSFSIGGNDVEAWLPLALGPVDPGQRSTHDLSVVGRLRSRETLQAARVEMEMLLAQWPTEEPGVHTPNLTNHRLVITPLLDDLVGNVQSTMRLLGAAVACLLFIACVNVANLQLVRSEKRQKEVAVRIALGAGAGRITIQFLAESIILAGLACAFGLLLAAWAVRVLVAASPESLPRVGEVGLDGSSVFFALLISLIAGIAFGFAPSIHARAVSFASTYKAGTQRVTAGVGWRRLRGGLVIVEVALAMGLVVSGGLLIRSFWLLQQVDPGVRTAGTLTFRISVPAGSYPQARQVALLYANLAERLAALPGVLAVAETTGLPSTSEANSANMILEGVPLDSQRPHTTVDFWRFVNRDYFQTLGINLIEGRFFDRRDTADSPGVVVINRSMAKAFWPGLSPIGQRLRLGIEGSHWMTIIGVAEDIKQEGLNRGSGTEVCFLHEQAPASVGFAPRTLEVALRTAVEPMSLANTVRKEVFRLDHTLPIDNVQTLDQVVAGSVSKPRFLALLVGVFAAVALFLAAVGTYGVLAFAVEQRSREIGIRMALGAQVGSVVGMVLWDGMQLVSLGLALGLGLAFACRSLLSSVLFGVSIADPLTLGALALLLALVSLVACYVPARRAGRIDPLWSLQQN